MSICVQPGRRVHLHPHRNPRHSHHASVGKRYDFVVVVVPTCFVAEEMALQKNLLIETAQESHTLVAIARACTFEINDKFFYTIIIICILSYHFLPLLSTMSHEMVPKCFRLTSIFQISFELSN